MLEYELHLATEGKNIKTCPQCGYHTFREACPVCLVEDKPLQLTGDSVIDDAFARIQAGEEVDLETLLRPENFAPVDPQQCINTPEEGGG